MTQENVESKIPFSSLVECIDRLNLQEKIRLLRILEDQVSNFSGTDDERHIWYELQLESLKRVWDNDADAVYDNWEEIDIIGNKPINRWVNGFILNK